MSLIQTFCVAIRGHVWEQGFLSCTDCGQSSRRSAGKESRALIRAPLLFSKHKS